MKNKMMIRFLAAATSAVMLAGTLAVGVSATAPAIVVEAADNTTTQALKSAFDPVFYANKYPDVKQAFGTNADALFSHFLNNGMKEGRMMNSNFDPKAYIAAYPDVKAYCNGDYTKAYEHYVTNGIREGRTLTTYDAINAKNAADQAAAQAAEQAAAAEQAKQNNDNNDDSSHMVYVGHGLVLSLNDDQYNNCNIFILTNDHGYGAFIDDEQCAATPGFYEFGSYLYSIVQVYHGFTHETVLNDDHRPYYDDLRDFGPDYNHDQSIEDALSLGHILSSMSDNN